MEDQEAGLKKYLSLWELSNHFLLASTPTSNVYEVVRDEKFILKVFTKAGAEDERASASVLQVWGGKGAVKLMVFDTGALLMERLEGPNLYSYSKNGGEPKATEVFVSIIKKIHSIPIPSEHSIPEISALIKPLEKFSSLELPDRDLFRKAHEVGSNLLKTTDTKVVLHGDLHHENVMRRKSGEYVCFDPKGFIGDPAYEIATILKNPWDYPEISENEFTCIERAKTFSTLLHLPLARVLKFAFVHMCLSTMWAIEDGNDFSHQFKIAQFLRKYAS